MRVNDLIDQELPVYVTSATMVIETCDHCFRPKSQLVRYSNCETIGNNDKH